MKIKMNFDSSKITRDVIVGNTKELYNLYNISIDELLEFLLNAKKLNASHIDIEEVYNNERNPSYEISSFKIEEESDEEFNKRQDAIALVKKIEFERLEDIKIEKEKKLLENEREVYERLKLKFENEEENGN